MLLVIVLLLIAAALVAILAVATINIRRRQAQLFNKKEASQLQRRAEHLLKIALASQLHTRQNNIAEPLLREAVRVLEQSLKFDPKLEGSTAALQECQELLASIEQEGMTAPANMEQQPDMPETELIEAQLHLTEASRLLLSLEKRGLLSYEELGKLQGEIKQAQRGIQLRLQLRVAGASISMERTVEQAGEYLEAERDKPLLSR